MGTKGRLEIDLNYFYRMPNGAIRHNGLCVSDRVTILKNTYLSHDIADPDLNITPMAAGRA